MIKQLAVVVAAAFVCVGAQAAYKDGTYTAEAMGNAGPIQVAVTVASGKITDVKVVKHGETDVLLKTAVKKVGKAIVKNNGTEGVVTVTGATNSSKGIIEAVNKALLQAK